MKLVSIELYRLRRKSYWCDLFHLDRPGGRCEVGVEFVLV